MNTKQKDTIIKRSAENISEGKIAKEVGVHQTTVSRFKNKPEIRLLIEKETERMLEALPDAIGQLVRDIKTSDKVSRYMSGAMTKKEQDKFLKSDGFMLSLEPKELISLQKLNYKKLQDLLRSAGVFPSNAPSTIIQTFIQKNSTEVIMPSVMKVISGHLDALTEDTDVIDVENTDE